MAHYYILLHPTEALVASSLDPASFATYMATGDLQGSAEQLVFCELTQHGFDADFDWDWARAECDGEKVKHSAYLGVYRVLERVPLEAFGALHLVTRDGRSLALEGRELGENERPDGAGLYLYQELCPIRSLVVSSLAPREFIGRLTGSGSRIAIPRLAVARLHYPQIGDVVEALFEPQALSHLRHCASQLRGADKWTKTVDRTRAQGFDYRHIEDGIYVGCGSRLLGYAFPSREVLGRDHYDWARSANLL